MLAVRKIPDTLMTPEFSVEIFNRTMKGLRAKTEVWCHTCWGNPSQQRMFTSVQSYKNGLEMLNKVDADVITFELVSAGGADLEAFGKIIGSDKKIAIGVIDHHGLQVERPEDIADHIRRALKHIPAERLILSSDCGMGREGMSRRHAYLQDRRHGARRQYGAQGAWPAVGRLPCRRPALFTCCAERLTQPLALAKHERAAGNFTGNFCAASICLCFLWLWESDGSLADEDAEHCHCRACDCRRPRSLRGDRTALGRRKAGGDG